MNALPDIARPRRALLPGLAIALLVAGCAQTPADTATNRDAAPVVTTVAAARTNSVPTTSARTPTPVDWSGLGTELQTILLDVPDNDIALLPDGLRVSLPANEGFAPGRVDVRAPLASLLTRVAPVLRRYPGASIQVVGHTDGVGSEMHNLSLSIDRAESVVEYLRREGVALARMSADGKGEAEPIADNTDPDGRARNRRIEFYLN